MVPEPYTRFNGSDLILRDHLAIDRTVLANERTILAYIRTSIILFGAAVTIIKFFPEQTAMQVLGGLFTLIAAGMLLVGWVRFARQRSALEVLRQSKR